MPTLLGNIIELVTGSLVLFSSIGIFVLTLNARYIHAIGRVREVYDELKPCEQTPKLAKELNILIHRCYLLKWSYILILCSAISSGIFLICAIFFRLLGNISVELLIVSIIFSVVFILGSMILLLIDVLISFRATLIHIDRIPVIIKSKR